MAANLQSRGLVNFGKRFVGEIRTTSDSLSLFSLRRGVHNSVYEKNTEEHVQPDIVPDHVIPPQKREYWTPHPQTGVFGPPTDGGPTPEGSNGVNAESVLEQKTFYRPLEDLELEKPVQN